MKHGDDIAAAVGGTLLAVLGKISLASMVEVVLFAFVGGIIGVFAKKIGEYAWSKMLCKKDKKKE